MGTLWEEFLKVFRSGRGGNTPPRSPDGWGEAESLLRALTDGGQAPGLAVRALHRGTCRLDAAFGFADLEDEIPAALDTKFRVASVSKPVTATALARLVAAGVVQLDDPLTRYVPEFPEHGIRLHHLAAHTAGIRGYRGKEYALNKPYTIEGSLELFRDDPLVFEPGTGFLYNSFDFVLLSLAMERAAGKSFHEIVRQWVLEPIGMRDTLPEIPGDPAARQAKFYTRYAGGFRPAPPVDTRYKLAGGGYLSTVADICRLGQAYLDGQVADSGVLREFLTSQKLQGAPTWYGLGWQVSRDVSGRRYYGHVGNAIGGYSNFFVYPEEEFVIAILMNCTDPGVQPVLDAIIDSLIPSIGMPGAWDRPGP